MNGNVGKEFCKSRLSVSKQLIFLFFFSLQLIIFKHSKGILKSHHDNLNNFISQILILHKALIVYKYILNTISSSTPT